MEGGERHSYGESDWVNLDELQVALAVEEMDVETLRRELEKSRSKIAELKKTLSDICTSNQERGSQRSRGTWERELGRLGGGGETTEGEGGAMEDVLKEQDHVHILRGWRHCPVPSHQLWVRGGGGICAPGEGGQGG
eukprot:513987-Hanusia_phi.AAC.4